MPKVEHRQLLVGDAGMDLIPFSGRAARPGQTCDAHLFLDFSFRLIKAILLLR